MELSEALISQFAKEVKASTETSKPVDSGVVVEGTAKQYGDAIYVQLDGSDQLTPVISSTAGMKDGDRVTVLIKDHSAKVTGNVSSPSTGEDEFNDYKEEVADTITEVEILIADKVSTEDFDAEKGRIDDLVSDNVTIKDRLTATEADIKDLTAENAEISGKLTAAEADIDDLTANMLTAEVADLKYATIENLSATNADVNNLETTYAQVSGKLTAAEADIDELQAKSLTVESADVRYAKIDFANIGEAAVENLFAKSGIIEDLVVSGGHVTGELVGVTIKGDLIEGGTVKADKLVVQGSDGLYYKLNVEGESVAAEQTEYNSLNGSVITAKSITAEKVNVDDLVAFNATIGGFNLTSGSLYSGVKSSLDNTTQGIYMDDQGQLAVGDGSNYLKYFKDTDGSWKLEISAESLKMSSSGTSIETTIQEIQNGLDETVVSMEEQFYKSSLPTELNGGSWSSTQPEWTGGTYIFRRTLVTYGDGHTEYTPSETGVCITGNTGDKGDPGTPGADGTSVTITSTSVTYQASSSGTSVPSGTWTDAIPSVTAGQYLWTKTSVSYSDGTSTVSYSVGHMGENGQPGADGSDGSDGRGIESTVITYQASSSQIATPTGSWTTTVPKLSAEKPYLWTRTVITYTDDTTTTAYSVSSTLDGVNVGGRNYILNSQDLGDSDHLDSEPGSKKEYMFLNMGQSYMNIPADTLVTISFDLTMQVNTVGTEPDGYPWLKIYNTNSPRLGPKYFNTTTIYLKELYPDVAVNDTISERLSFQTPIKDRPEESVDSEDNWIEFWSDYGTSNWFKIENLKLELGNIATDWTPAPEDQTAYTDEVSGMVSDLDADISENIDQIVSNIGDIQDNMDIVAETVTETTTRVAELEQFAEGWSFDFTTIQETVTQLGDEFTTVTTEQLKYIKFIDGEIWLGRDPDPGEDDFKVVISNERIRFLQNNVEVAYISNNQLYITNAKVTQRLDIGNFAFFPRDNGNLTLRFTG